MNANDLPCGGDDGSEGAVVHSEPFGRSGQDRARSTVIDRAHIAILIRKAVRLTWATSAVGWIGN